MQGPCTGTYHDNKMSACSSYLDTSLPIGGMNAVAENPSIERNYFWKNIFPSKIKLNCTNSVKLLSPIYDTL
jgi:hypothetical protein